VNLANMFEKGFAKMFWNSTKISGYLFWSYGIKVWWYCRI